MDINWIAKKYAGLDLSELYEMLKLRSEVFVVEQHCIYLDMDGLDSGCFHLLGWTSGGKLAAYARILPVGVEAYGLQGVEKGPHGSIGRLVVATSCRGIGHLLLDKALEAYDEAVGKEVSCIIHAQAHLRSFYEKHGFRQCSDLYLIDGIRHIEMVRKAVPDMPVGTAKNV